MSTLSPSFATLTKLKLVLSGFLLLPSLIALVGILLAFITVAIDRAFMSQVPAEQLGLLGLGVSGARSVLSTISGAMMTVLSLVYSLTLVVFTLAAGNIGPRLLTSFSQNRVSQVTIGMLGATFLYALFVLYMLVEHDEPRISTIVAIFLAAASFFCLVYFVHDVSQQIMVDNAIGRTQRAFRREIDRILLEEPAESEEEYRRIPSGEGTSIVADAEGYITGVDIERLLQIATENDCFIEMKVSPGDFVFPRTRISVQYGAEDKLAQKVQSCLLLADARAPEGDLRFHVYLSVEIALRALSAGVNDAYTAISAIDHLCASLSIMMQRGVPSSLACDNEGTPRVWCCLINLEDTVSEALHILRRATNTNFQVQLHLVKTIGKMLETTPSYYQKHLHEHLLAIASSAKNEIKIPLDRREMAEQLSLARRKSLYRS